MKTRCSWVNPDDPLMVDYHDREWGLPVHDDRRHFEFLVLEAAQAGLSWSTCSRDAKAIAARSAISIPRKVARFTRTRRSRN